MIADPIDPYVRPAAEDPRRHLLGRLAPGVEITVKGAGRFRFDRYADDVQAVTCWGPVLGGRGSWRTFPLDRVRIVHRTTKGRPA